MSEEDDVNEATLVVDQSPLYYAICGMLFDGYATKMIGVITFREQHSRMPFLRKNNGRLRMLRVCYVNSG
jgi:hypothetical protein